MYTTSYLTYELLAKRYALLLCNLDPCVAGFYTVRDGRNKVIVIIDNNSLLYRHRIVYEEIKKKIINENVLCGDQWDIFFVVFTPAKDELLKGRNVLLVNQNTGSFGKWGISKSCTDQCNTVMQILNKQKILSQKASLRGIEFIMPRKHKIVFTYIIAILCIVVFNLNTLLGLDMGYSTELVCQGDYWRLFTYMFAHANVWHLLGNVTALCILGPVLERQAGSLRFVTAYLLSGMFASYTSVCLGLNPGAVTVGASGAICGILGATIAVSLLTPKFYRRTNTAKLVMSMVFVLATGVVQNLLGSNIDNWCHLWGSAGGFLVMMIIQLMDRKQLLKLRMSLEK